MKSELTVGIVTCGRPSKIATCLRSVRETLGRDVSVMVLDSSWNDETKRIYAGYSGVDVLGFASPVSPSAARRMLAEKVSTPLLLYLDDDIILENNTVGVLHKHLQRFPDTGLVSAAWRETSGYRELAQTFHQATDEKGSVIFKRFLERDRCLATGLQSVQADGLHATMMVRTEVFKSANFDPEFGFYLELFDFFMQCKRQGFKSEALTGTFFWHRPTAYKRTTNRQSVPKSQGVELFVRKWGLRPVGPLGLTPASSSFPARLKRLIAGGR